MSRRHMVNFTTTTPLGCRFREAIDVSGAERDSENTCKDILGMIERLPEEERDSLVTLVTDTPSVNKKMWKLVEKKMPKLTCVPCGGHCMNLHFKHVEKE